jgi:2-succinyl-6-hydroxy-2,4-cyclohexadiene-1-carboxylate synthase
MGSDVEKINFIGLHGFLGQASDWDLIQSHLMVSKFARNFEWWSVDYMNTPILNPKNSFLMWAQNFNQKARLKFSAGPRVLVGYSLGGRLALHALAESPKLYDAVILLSTNPGLVREKEKQDRWQNDLRWSKKFLQLPWPELLREWNAQNVFKDSVAEPQRTEAAYDRALLADALTEWSLAKQADFRELIASQHEKIFWLSGDKDIKFLSLAMELQKRTPSLQAGVISKSSHRALFDNPSEVAGQMIHFLEGRYL